MEALGRGRIRFRIYSPDQTEFVAASVFANKLATLVRALSAADKALNGRNVHEYVIRRLTTSEPTAILGEMPRPRFMDDLQLSSGVGGFEACARAVQVGDSRRALSFGRCANYIEALGRGTQRDFSYGEVWTSDNNVIRIDGLLEERAREVVSPPEIEAQPERQWYKGEAHGSFEGIIRVVDLRGALPEVKLVLSPGDKAIDCVLRTDHVEDIRAALDRRARVSGRAIYTGKSGLPRRVEVSEIEVLGDRPDFSVWKGAFEPFDAPDWPEPD